MAPDEQQVSIPAIIEFVTVFLILEHCNAIFTRFPGFLLNCRKLERIVLSSNQASEAVLYQTIIIYF